MIRVLLYYIIHVNSNSKIIALVTVKSNIVPVISSVNSYFIGSMNCDFNRKC